MVVIKNISSIGFLSVLLFACAACAASTIEIFSGCNVGQGLEIKKVLTSEYYFKQSGKSEVCVLRDNFISDSDFQSIEILWQETGGVDEAFEAIDTLINIPGEIVGTDGPTISIRLTEDGIKVMSEMTRRSDVIYVVIDNLVVTNVSIFEPVNNGALELYGIDGPVYSAFKKVKR
ncbi:MAG: hypothetical protein DHS20C01_26230 [marine bacterium B5-7]|nr:MAG: hypothetical protein DHS20C01_26230 [marine bacterium B5-7]